MKRCFKCGTDKPQSEFYCHPQMADGLLGKCIACAKADVRLNRLAKLNSIRAYDRERAKLPHRIAASKRVVAQWRKKHPDRTAAHNAAQRATHLVRPLLCEACSGLKRLERHHPDYSQPLLIVWLCKPCHAAADKVRRLAESAA